MTGTKDQIINLIYESIDEYNSQFEPTEKLEKNKEMVLFGQNGKLDSLGLVNFIVTVEEKIVDSFDKSITLADEKAMSQKNSPFRSVDAFADYISSLLAE